MTKPTGKPRGRPAFVPTKEQRENVAIWKAGGMTDENIARALGMDADTVKKHFAEELAAEWCKKVAKVISARFKAAVKGNVSAQTKFLETARAVGAESRLQQPNESGRKPRVVPIGKKEAADEAAKTAGLGTEWGQDLQPPPTIQ
jgi:hypothetical protein